MNSSFIFIFLAIFIITVLVYLLYKIMLNSDDSSDKELQITSEELLTQLNILHKEKKYNIVESLAKNYLCKKSHDNSVRTILTKSLYSLGKIHEAIQEAKIIIKHQPDNSNMHIFLANCYMEIGESSEAIDEFQKVLEKYPDNIVAIKELAQIYLKTNQKKSAIKMYKKLEEFIDSNLEKAKNKALVADIYIEFKEFKAAISEYQEILEIYPDDLNIKKRLIDLYNVTEDYTYLIEMANELLALSPQSETGLWAMTILMETYRKTGDYEQALNLADLIKTHPMANQNQVKGDIAQILFDEGKADESIELLNSLLAEEPNNISLQKSLANAYESKQNFEQAIDIYSKIVELADANQIKELHFYISNIYSNWAMSEFSKNENDNCFKYFTLALKYCEDNPEIYYRLGNVNKLIKNFNESISNYKKAIELNPKNSDYYYEISECYEGIGSIYEQKAALMESLKYNPNNVKANYKLGITCYTQNDRNSAMNYLKAAVNLDDNFIPAKHKLALMLENTGDKDSAIKLYKEILAISPDNQEVINNLKMLT